MTLRPQPLPPVPEATVAAVQAAFPRGHRDVALRTASGALYDDQCFAELYPPSGRPVEVAPWRLALVVVMQYSAGLTERQAADAVGRRLDGKYALSLELTVRLQARHEALQAARQRQETAEFKAQYALRAGVESSLSQGSRRSDLRRSRDLGLVRTHLQQLLTAMAMHVVRVIAWLWGKPLGERQRQPGHLARLAPYPLSRQTALCSWRTYPTESRPPSDGEFRRLTKVRAVP